jgi:hypothetical protein
MQCNDKIYSVLAMNVEMQYFRKCLKSYSFFAFSILKRFNELFKTTVVVKASIGEFEF